jgi:hypothetical protein
MTSFELLVLGVLLIYSCRRVSHWMHRRGWIRWKMRRGTSSSLGNAVLGVQGIFEPAAREIIEARLEERADEGEPGDPPDPGRRRRVIR